MRKILRQGSPPPSGEMCGTMNRRSFVNGCVIAAAGVAGFRQSAGLGASRDASGRYESVALGRHVEVIRSPASNIVFAGEAGGLVMVDSGMGSDADWLAGTVGADSRRPSVLFNTNWRPSQSGGNDVLGELGTPIVAHENARLWMSTHVYVGWEGKEYEPRAQVALPTKTYFGFEPQAREMDVGGRHVEYGYLYQAFTDGDTYVYFPDDGVLVAGGVVAGEGYPILDYSTGGWIGGMIDALELLLSKIDARTRIVPARGPVRCRDDVERQLEMLMKVRERVEREARNGRSVQDMVADGLTRDFDSAWGEPSLFLETVYHGLWHRLGLLG